MAIKVVGLHRLEIANMVATIEDDIGYSQLIDFLKLWGTLTLSSNKLAIPKYWSKRILRALKELLMVDSSMRFFSIMERKNKVLIVHNAVLLPCKGVIDELKIELNNDIDNLIIEHINRYPAIRK